MPFIRPATNEASLSYFFGCAGRRKAVAVAVDVKVRANPGLAA